LSIYKNGCTTLHRYLSIYSVLAFAQDGGVGKTGYPCLRVAMVGFGESELNDYYENGCG
jgi:hypothetical protein